MSTFFKAFKDGFYGSFKLAAALALAIVGLASTFAHHGADVTLERARHLGQ